MYQTCWLKIPDVSLQANTVIAHQIKLLSRDAESEGFPEQI